MSFFDKSDVVGLLDSTELIEDVIHAIDDDPEAMDDLAGEVASALEQAMQEYPEVRRKLVDTAMSRPEIRRRIAKKLVEDMN